MRREEMADQKFKTSNVNVCLKAIKEYLDAVENPKITNLQDFKDRAEKAVEHLSTIFGPGDENVMVDTCPSISLPTI
jgi:hypothetical protein